MKTLINIGSKRSKKNITKLSIFIKKVFKVGSKYDRSKEEVVAALDLAVKAFSSEGATISGCTLTSGKQGKGEYNWKGRK